MNEQGQIHHLLQENSDLRMERRKLRRKYERLHDALTEIVALKSTGVWDGNMVLAMLDAANDALNADMLDAVVTGAGVSDK